MEECKICGKSYKRITASHLNTHDITLEEYLKLYKKEEYKERKLAEFLMESYVYITRVVKMLNALLLPLHKIVNVSFSLVRGI